MLSAAEFRTLALKAKKDARDYRREARLSRPERRQMLLKWAENRDADSAFYASRALIAETAKHHSQEAAA